MALDVFMSFRGQDVRKGFISHLYREFSQKGIRSFLNKEEDEEEKDRERQISPSLLGAISESKVAVVVLSKYYTSSVWCLDELDKIMGHARKKSTPVVPVFYEVDSSDVRHQRGRFGEDFERHGQREHPETLQRWRDALIKLTNKPGFSSHALEDDSKLVREITRHVSGLLSKSRLSKELLPGKASEDQSTAKKTSSSRLVSNSNQFMTTIFEISKNSLVAMDRHMVMLHKVLELQSTNEIRMIGISGVRGIGKTTIARFLHQKLSPSFQDHYFLDNSRITNGKPTSLSEKLTPGFQDHCLLQTSMSFHDQGLVSRASSSGSREELPSPRGLKRKALQTSSDLSYDDKRTRVWHQRALVIVDNVETSKQLEEIMKDVSWLGSGSRVIITTQDKSLLLDCGVEHVYEVDYLRYDEALELFSVCAFKKQYPPVNFEQLSVRAVQLSGCLPLGLKLLGSFLCGKAEEDWESELLRLEAKQDNAIVEMLKISAQEDWVSELQSLDAEVQKSITSVAQGYVSTKEDWECEVQRLETKQKKIKTLLNS